MASLKNKKIAVLATHGVEESELLQPLRAFRDAGSDVDLISIAEDVDEDGAIQSSRHLKKGVRVKIDRVLDPTFSDQYDALYLPGGAMNADRLRSIPEVLEFVRAFQADERPIAAICHAPWILISAGLVRGRNMTSYYTIKDDVKNAGANWTDQEVVVDGNWVTSRQPKDIPAFLREAFELFSEVTPLISRATRKALSRARIA